MSDMAHKHKAWRDEFSRRGECCKQVDDVTFENNFSIHIP